MNYKSLIKSRGTRVLILSLLNWIPDSVMIPLQYRIHTGRKLDKKNPSRFTEKMQLYKLRYRNPQMLRATDKLEVRSLIKEKGFGDLLIPVLQVINAGEQVDFKVLPERFVAKTTDGGGGNEVFVCRDKNSITEEELNRRIEDWFKAPKAKKSAGREWAYENGFPRRVIIEELISDGENKDLPDYKFYCFDGKPVYCQMIGNRSTKETIDFYDMDWNHQPFRGLNKACENADKPAPRPKNLEKMIEIATKLSKGFPFVRVDLYSVGDRVYFGELTFYPASGLGHFTPDEWDERLGNLLPDL